MAASRALNLTVVENIAYPEMHIDFFVLKRIFPVIIAVVGLFGNTVSLLITTRKEYRGISTMVYMSGLAVLDNLYCFDLGLLAVFVYNGYEWKIPNRRMMTM